VLGRAFALLSEDDREVLRLIAWEQLALRVLAGDGIYADLYSLQAAAYSS
jgi:hypothetical protein